MEDSVSKIQTGRKNKQKKFKKGELNYYNGIPFLRLSGSYYEMGFQYGVLMKEELHEVCGKIDILKNNALSIIPRIFKSLIELFIKVKLSFLSKRLPQKYVDELQGLADGSGISYHVLLNLTLFLELTANLSSVSDLLSKTDCSTILIKDNKSVLHGRNFDFIPLFLGDYPVIIEYNPIEKTSYTSVGIIGYHGVFTGVNIMGLTASLNISLGFKKMVRDIPITYKVREILENCSKLSEVDKELKSFQSEVGMLLAVTSKLDQDGVIFDLGITGRKKNCIENKGYIFACNRFLSDEISRKETPILFGNSYLNLAREERIEDLVPKVANISDLVDLLSDVQYCNYPEMPVNHNGTINNERTLQTVIIDTNNNDIYISSAPGLAGWSNIIKYNMDDKIGMVYRESNPARGRYINYLKWYEKVFFLVLKKDYKNIARITCEFSDYGRAHLIMLEEVWNNKLDFIDFNIVTASLEQNLSKYKDLGFLYKFKGKILLQQNKIKEGIEVLQEGLTKKIFPAEQIEIYHLLAIAYNKSGDKINSTIYAQKCRELLNSLSNRFQIGKKEEGILKIMNKINS